MTLDIDFDIKCLLNIFETIIDIVDPFWFKMFNM